MLAVVAAVAVAGTKSFRPGSTTQLPVSDLHVAAGGVTADQLRAYRWRTLPAAPISARDRGAVGIWTGSAMLVWGGASADGVVHNDGASYDPVRRAWHRMARAPSSPVRRRLRVDRDPTIRVGRERW